MPSMPSKYHDMPFSLLAGGFHHCDPAWNKPFDGIDRCYKLYFPVRGQAQLIMDTQQVTLRAGYAYLIPGYHLVRQQCQRSMDVYWVHFVPHSLYLANLLSKISCVHSWKQSAVEYWRTTYRQLRSVCSGIPAWLDYRIQAMVMDLVSRVLENAQLDPTLAVNRIYEQLQPAIQFMDRRTPDNPTLAEIAKTVHLAPNYFHRLFTATFQVTPFNYMLRRRLNMGRQLLLSTNLTLDRIAGQTGFSSAFHFSKLFKKHCGLSPQQLRKQAMP